MIGEFRGKKPAIPKSAFVAENATLIGDVRLGEGSSVWFGAVLRADIDSITIGDRSNIQELCVIHVDENKPVVIGNDVTVGHAVTLHGCTIEDCCLIGMGAVVLDGAVIGTGSIVAASALIPPGKRIPPHTLVGGVPAKTMRKLSDEDYETLKHHAAAYAELAEEHKKA